MLAVFILPVLLFSQLAAAVPSDMSLRDLEELYKLLNEEKRNLEREDSFLEMSKRKDSDMIEKCDQVPLELGIIIDSSSSIRKDDYQKGLEFVSKFLNKYVISQEMVRVAAVSFGRGVYTDLGFNLTTYSNNASVLAHIKQMKHQYGGRTDTGDAMQHMREVQMNDQMTRPGVPKMVIVLTDGNSQMWTKTKAEGERTRDAGIKVIAVGVGRSVKYEELVRIAGGIEENVLQKASYSMLDDDTFMSSLFSKTCIWVPRPTTTPPPTTTLQAIEPCGKDFPTDINFVFSPASLGLEHTSFATRFVERVMEQEQLSGGTQYGLVTGVCPTDEGFTLRDYSQMDKETVQERLRSYDYDKLPELVKMTTTERFSPSNGGQSEARKVAVIFAGPGKDKSGLQRQINEMVDSGVEVYVSTRDWTTHNALSSLLLPNESITLLTPESSSLEQAVQMTNDLCAPVYQ